MLSIVRENINNINILKLDGRIEIQSISALQEQVDKIIADNPLKLIIDTRNLDYVSSTGIRLFLILYRFFSDKDKEMIICGLNTVVDRIFEIAGLKQIFQIEDDCKNAVKKLL